MKSVAENGRLFLASKVHATALLTIPGCGPVGISPSHWNQPSLRFDGDDRLVISDLADYMAVVAALTGNDSSNPIVDRLSIRSLLHRCYCGKVLSILALRKEHCIHEAHGRTLVDLSSSLDSMCGWEFNLLRGSTPKLRRYQILKVHSRLVAKVSPPRSLGVEAILQVRMVPAEHFVLVVSGLPEEGQLTARVDVVFDNRSSTIIPEFTKTVSPNDEPEYVRMEERLKEAHAAPRDTHEILSKAKACEPAMTANYPVEEVIASILEFSGGKPPRKDLIRRRIEMMLARLWDGPVVGDAVRFALDGALYSREFQRQSSRYPLPVRSELANLTMPLTKLELGDEYTFVATPPIPSAEREVFA